MIQALQHSRMLRDKVRLAFYQDALQNSLKAKIEMSKNPDCVDIGSGTGILAEFARAAGYSRVHLVEYFDEIMRLSKLSLEEHDSSFSFHSGSSYSCQLKLNPGCTLVTETIGLIGPEENIVELTYDFCRRHPAVDTVLPAELTIMAAPFRSAQLDSQRREELDAFDHYAATRAVQHEYALDLSSQIRFLDAPPADFQLIETSSQTIEPVRLVHYALGRDSRSDFDFVLPDLGENVFWHLYFVARAGNVELSSRAGSRTHWNFCYVYPSPTSAAQSVRIFYKAGSGSVGVSYV
jgi:protein arginine N-methyltransferase 1